MDTQCDDDPLVIHPLPKAGITHKTSSTNHLVQDGILLVCSS